MKLRDLVLGAPSVPKSPEVTAADYMPINSLDSFGAYFSTQSTATREEAMQIPSIARARNIIASSIASFEIQVWDKATGSKIDPPRVINQPDPRITGASVWSWCVEDLLFYGYSYFYITERYAEDGRVRAMQRIAPNRVTVQTNSTATEITGYYVNGKYVPFSDLVIFSGMDEGLLNRAGQTLKAGYWLERASLTFAREPAPQMVMKSNGTSLPADRIRTLMNSWSRARTERATAFLNADVILEKLGFDPKEMQLNEARQYVALELARQIGIPAWFISADPQSNTYSNAINQRRDLIDFSLRPIMTVIEQRLSQNDFLPSSQYARYDLDDFLRGNPLERAQVYQILNGIRDDQGNPVLTIDEIREEEDLVG